MPIYVAGTLWFRPFLFFGMPISDLDAVWMPVRHKIIWDAVFLRYSFLCTLIWCSIFVHLEFQVVFVVWNANMWQARVQFAVRFDFVLVFCCLECFVCEHSFRSTLILSWVFFASNAHSIFLSEIAGQTFFGLQRTMRKRCSSVGDCSDNTVDFACSLEISSLKMFCLQCGGFGNLTCFAYSFRIAS